MKLLTKFASLAVCLGISLAAVGGIGTAMAEEKVGGFSVAATGATVMGSEETYSGSGEGVVLAFDKKDARLTIRSDDLGEYGIFDDVVVDLRLRIDGSGYSEDPKLYSAEDDLIDYGFPLGVWNRVRYKTKVYADGEGKFVLLDVFGANGKTAYVSDITVSALDVKAPFFGGVKLWSMDGVNLMQSYVMQTSDGKVVVIDGGAVADTDNLVRFLRTFSNKVDHWFITHFHSDHASALLTILKYQDVRIENLYYDFPTSATVKSLSGDSDGYICDDMNEAVEAHPEKVGKVIKPKKGDEYRISDDLTVYALNDAWFEKNNNYGNNSGIMYKAVTPGEGILFTGDMGDRGDYWLDDEWVREQVASSTVVQMAHHGQNGVTDKFYQTIRNVKMCLYPAAQWIYDNSNGAGFNSATLKTLHTRDLVREWGCLYIYKQFEGRRLIL